MSSFVAHKTRHKGQTYVCNGCLHPFTTKEVLGRHFPYCVRNPPQVVRYPNPKEDKNSSGDETANDFV